VQIKFIIALKLEGLSEFLNGETAGSSAGQDLKFVMMLLAVTCVMDEVSAVKAFVSVMMDFQELAVNSFVKRNA
jgi:hypothetical protein